MSKIFIKFIPFWLFLIFFKFGGGLHYSLISPLGSRLFPLWLVGILMGGASVIQLLFDVPAGHILDRYGYKRFLKVTTFVFLFAGICLIFGFTKITYLVSIFFSIFGWLFFGPGINAYILSHAPNASAGRFISLRDVFGSVGIVLSSASLPFILILSPQQIGIVLTILLLVALIAISVSPKDHASARDEIKLPTHHYYINRTFLSKTLKVLKRLNPASTILLILNLTASTFYGVIWFVVPLVIASQANNNLLGIGLGVFDFAVVVLGFLLGSLADKSNKRTMVFFGLLVFSLAGMILGFNFGWLFILFGFLATSGEEMASISLWSWLHGLDKDHYNDGAISGALNLFDDLGWSIGPIVAGIAYGLIGPTWTIVLGAIPIFILWIIYQIVSRYHAPHKVSVYSIPKKPHRSRHKS